MEDTSNADFIRPDFVMDFVLVDEKPSQFDISGTLDPFTGTRMVEQTVRCRNQRPDDACSDTQTLRPQEFLQPNEVR